MSPLRVPSNAAPSVPTVQSHLVSESAARPEVATERSILSGLRAPGRSARMAARPLTLAPGQAPGRGGSAAPAARRTSARTETSGTRGRDARDKADSPAKGIARVQRLNKVLDTMFDARRLLSYARSLYPDAADLALALAEVARMRRSRRADGKETGETDVAADIAMQARKRLLEEDGHAYVMAGANVTQTAFSHAKPAGLSMRTLRETYQLFIVTEEGERALYLDWVERFGYPSVSRVIDFIEAAFVADRHAVDPSCSDLAFGNVLNHLARLRLMRSASATFLSGLHQQCPLVEEAGLQTEWVGVMSAALVHAARARDAIDTRVASLARLAGVPEERLWPGVLHAFSALPVALFADEQATDRVAAAAMALPRRSALLADLLQAVEGHQGDRQERGGLYG